MEDDMLLDEEKVTLNLIAEFVRHFNAIDITWAWFGPLPADLAGLTDLRYELEDLFTYPNTVEESSHRVFGCMPPSNV